MTTLVFYFDLSAINLVLDFLGLILSLIAIILSLRIVWRVEKRLDTFFKLLTLFFVIVLFSQVIRLLFHLGMTTLPSWLGFLEILPLVVVIIALAVMNNLIKKLDREK